MNNKDSFISNLFNHCSYYKMIYLRNYLIFIIKFFRYLLTSCFPVSKTKSSVTNGNGESVSIWQEVHCKRSLCCWKKSKNYYVNFFLIWRICWQCLVVLRTRLDRHIPSIHLQHAVWQSAASCQLSIYTFCYRVKVFSMFKLFLRFTIWIFYFGGKNKKS